jgi:UDP-N-acetylglucosamine diphosphorylase / glucose-1-phosphate thymidylyltransferase / UDP-N-acetylgalactosamine diphosphorylase / glucosamine-1-phosphate N-acetyltransferase / galactosamine-1-phosphate N-acetyltransferase
MNKNFDNLVVVMPMAGRSQRFKEAGVMIPKPLITVAGMPMILRATSSLSFFDLIPRENIVAIVRPDDMRKYKIDLEIIGLLPGVSVLTDERPRGATSTALVAKDYILPDSRVLVMDCDIWFRSPAYEELLLNPQTELSGAIPVFAAEGDRWSFSAVDSKSIINRIVEKRRINVPNCTLLANVGFYYFAKGIDFLSYSEAALNKNLSDTECYLSQVVQEMIQIGLPFRAAMCDSVMDMGTPESHRKAEVFFGE